MLHSEVRQNLVVYTYDSFNSDWGPGPQLEKAFENICDCDLKFVTAGDGAALLAKLRLEGNKTKADVVVGLDTNLLQSAKDSGLFSPHKLNISLDLPLLGKMRHSCLLIGDIFLLFLINVKQQIFQSHLRSLQIRSQNRYSRSSKFNTWVRVGSMD